MEQFSYTIRDELGIHARPAGQLVREAARFAASVSISTGGKQASAKKLFSLMGLCAKQGDELLVQVEGKDEKEAAADIRRFLENNL